MRSCTKCKEAKGLDCFYLDRSKADGYHSICKACHKQSYLIQRASNPASVLRARNTSKQWKLDNPERSRLGIRCATLRKKYNISAAEFDLLFEEQGRCCAICSGIESKGYGSFHVDHDHKTGKIRGILCQACNVTLGKMMDSPALLRQAADYLER